MTKKAKTLSKRDLTTISDMLDNEGFDYLFTAGGHCHDIIAKIPALFATHKAYIQAREAFRTELSYQGVDFL